MQLYAPKEAATPCKRPHVVHVSKAARCSPAHSGLEPYVLQVHGVQSAVTGKVMDALASHGVSTYVRLMG